ncbi:hypothetical protein DPEC_G00075550 [Dallia pectoralis]|uniref:Uncharacterized protein n=1 Tax=Dallia pectoralis TaxID=75939 RepID=A0ACC2H381_DALPE|nr:hypothetical protein DPEC_G00075550 [Dallia pectoralis]
MVMTHITAEVHLQGTQAGAWLLAGYYLQLVWTESSPDHPSARGLCGRGCNCKSTTTARGCLRTSGGAWNAAGAPMRCECEPWGAENNVARGTALCKKPCWLIAMRHLGCGKGGRGGGYKPLGRQRFKV